MKVRRIEDRKLSESFIEAVEEYRIEEEKTITQKMAQAFLESHNYKKYFHIKGEGKWKN